MVAGSKALIEPLATIEREVLEYKRSPKDGRLRVLVDRWKKLLLDAALAYRAVIDPRWVGVHPSNRGGVGLICIDVHTLLKRVAAFGWVMTEVLNACAFECDGDKEIQQFNTDLVAKSGGLLAPITDALKVATVECSHTTGGLRAVKAGVRAVDNPELADDQGRLSLARLRERCSEHARCVDEGIQYLVVKKSVAKAIPDLPRLFSQAGNLLHETLRQESEWSVLTSMHALAKQGLDWDKIADEIASLKPSYASCVKDLCTFVDKWSGGKEGSLLSAVERCIVHSDVKRSIPPSVFASFGQLVLHEATIYIEACFVALYSAPAKWVDPGTNSVRLLTHGDIMSIGARNRAMVLEASKILLKGKALVEASSLSRDVKTNIIVDFYTRMVMRVHLKSKDHASIEHVGAALWDDLVAGGATLKGKCPWNRPSPSTTTPAPGMREFTATGVNRQTVLAELARKGIKVEAKLVLKTDASDKPVEYIVESIAKDSVVFKGGETKAAATVLDMFKVLSSNAPQDKLVS